MRRRTLVCREILSGVSRDILSMYKLALVTERLMFHGVVFNEAGICHSLKTRLENTEPIVNDIFITEKCHSCETNVCHTKKIITPEKGGGHKIT